MIVKSAQLKLLNGLGLEMHELRVASGKGAALPLRSQSAASPCCMTGGRQCQRFRLADALPSAEVTAPASSTPPAP